MRESLGISADGSEKAFNSDDVEAFMARIPPELYVNRRMPMDNVQWTFTAVDPSGGGASAFSICTITQDPKGFLHVRLLLSCPPRPSPPRSARRPTSGRAW